MPEQMYMVRWKKNRNHRGEEKTTRVEAMKIADEKKSLGFKVEVKKLPKERRGVND